MKKLYLVLAVLFSLYNLHAQEFYYGAYLDKGDSTNELLYSYVGDSLKMNTIIQYANGDNNTQRNMLSRFNLIAVKADSPEDAVLHYSHGYYTKWEAEDTTENTRATGMKAKYGNSTTYLNTNCWTSGTNPQYIGDTLLYGPHYRQDKKYRLNHMLQHELKYDLQFRIAGVYLNPQSTPTGDSVCTISVVFTYKIGEQFYNDTLKSITLFDTWLTDTFKDTSITYEYPDSFTQYNSKLSSLNERELLSYDDTYPGTGIQFRVTWYGKMQLYIDKFEVYDQQVGKDFINQYEDIVQACNNFVNKYNSWNNIKYFFNLGEPQTLDLYTPARIVDSILADLNAPRGLAEFYPQWEGQRNGDRTIKKFVEMANPSKVMMEFINYFLEGHTLDWEYEQQRGFLQELHSYRPDFWYEPLIAAPFKKFTNPPQPCWLREATPSELNASLMLGLAHGTKGIIFWKMVSSGAKEFNCNNDSVTYRCLLNSNGNSFTTNPLFHYLKDSFSPRITGKLGSTLLKLKYTGNYLRLRKNIGTESENGAYSYIELIDPTSSSDTMNFHGGLFYDNLDMNYNKHFLLTNLVTNNQRPIKIKISNPFTGFNNVRFRDIEGSFDTTFTDTCSTGVKYFEAGDGKLFQVAPVIKYGGKLIANETVSSNTTLSDSLIVNPGVTLTINSTITSYGNIYLKNGAKLKTTNSTNGGFITFMDGKRLIIEGDVEINGLPNNKLTLDFTTPSNDNGIKVYSGSKLTIKHTIIKNAYKGIFIDEGELFIDSSEVTDCNTGLYLNETVYQPDVQEGTKIWHTTFYGNYHSITLLEGSAMIVGNNFTSIASGVVCLENSSPMFGELMDPGLNNFGHNSIHIYSHESYPIVGISGEEWVGGYNSFERREIEYHVYAMENSTVMAEQNYWGEAEPEWGYFLADFSSYISYYPYFSSPSFEYRAISRNSKYAASSNAGLELTKPSENYKQALRYLFKRDKYNCRILLKNILQNYSDSTIAFAALNLLYKSYLKTAGIDSLKQYLQQITATNSQRDIIVYGKLLLADIDKTDYTLKLNNLLTSYANSGIKDLIYFKMFKHYLFEMHSLDSARMVSNQMLTLFPESPLTKETKYLLGDNIFQKINSNSQLVLLSFFIGNYPNPFNPTTTIRYDLPKVEKVNISVYDILGRNVGELVSEEKEAGRYEVQFNASNLSSGCYFYRIITKDFAKTMKTMVIK